MAKKKTAVAKKSSVKHLTFEQSLDELEKIVAKLESGQLGLTDSLAAYEQGVHHLKSCYHQLSAAEQRIELVTKVDASGKPHTEVFDDEASVSLDKKGVTRNRRRGSSANSAKAKQHRGDVDDGSSLF